MDLFMGNIKFNIKYFLIILVSALVVMLSMLCSSTSLGYYIFVFVFILIALYIFSIKEYRMKKDKEIMYKIEDFEKKQEEYISSQNKILQETLLFSESIINSVNEGIIVYDLDLRFIEWNRYMEKITSFSKEEIVGKKVYDVFPITLENGVYENLKVIVESGIERTIEFEYKNEKSGKKYWLQDSNRHLRNDKNEIVGIIVSVVDVTSYKEYEIDLEKAKDIADKNTEAQKRFMANMSHEIRTPMNGLLGMIDLTLMSDLDYEQRTDLEVAKNSGKVLLQVINDILDYSRLESNGIVIKEEKVEIVSLIKEVDEIFRSAANLKNIELKLSISSELPSIIFSDYHRLRQIISNLLGNAIKFTNEGVISQEVKLIEMDSENVTIKFVIKDTGIGIAKEHSKTLFDRFTQADDTITRKFGGSGLGLSISKGLTELMGGELDYTSIEGIGSEFFVKLKFKYSSDNTTIKSSRESMIFKPIIDNTINILIVDDDLASINLLSKYLAKKGVSSSVAKDGESATDLYFIEEFDMIFMDISMPIMNGSDATKIIKSSEKYLMNPIPIIAQTAYALSGDREKFTESIFDGYISKPLDYKAIDDLLAKLNN